MQKLLANNIGRITIAMERIGILFRRCGRNFFIMFRGGSTIIHGVCLMLLTLGILFGMCRFTAHGAAVTTFFTYQEVPDMLKWCPAPPDTTSSAFVYDIMCYIKGKEQRKDKERAAQAISDVNKNALSLCTMYQDAFGIPLSNVETPNIYHLLDRTIRTASYGAYSGKNHYRRKRPYVRFNEPTLIPNQEASLAKEGSYPSSHTIVGWSAALLLAEINPDAAVALLMRGYEFGQSRVIAGYHWQSDVMAGYLVASTVYAKLHTNSEFLQQLKLARQEYHKIIDPPCIVDTFYTQPPNMLFWFSAPPEDGSPAFIFDLTQYYAGVDMRQDAYQEEQALNDVSCDIVPLSASFSDALGLSISETKTPTIYEVLQWAHRRVMEGAGKYQRYFNRERPFAQLNVPSMIPELDDSLKLTGSYPSQHAALGWLFALLLEEVNPAAQDDILARGFQYGQNQVITGHQWQSDVDAGRMLAMAYYAFLRSNKEFAALMQEAQKEFFNKKYMLPHDLYIDTDISTKPSDRPDADTVRVETGRFSVNGMRVGERAKGIIINNGKKIVGGY